MNLRLWTRLRGVRLTRDGGWFCIVLLCIALIALNTGNNLLTVNGAETYVRVRVGEVQNLGSCP